MSVEDMKYVEKVTSKRSRTATAAAAAPRRVSDDDVPLAVAKRASMAASKKAPNTDYWFDFFLSAGCELDDCTRYAASFERDKIDETILLDITDATMRSLGLREGDIIRVTKAIDKRRPQEKKSEPVDDGPTKSPPNLFTTPGGALKNPRRGRPQPSKSLPATVDLQAISTVSDQIQRTSSPQVLTPTTVQPPPRSSSVLAPTPASGFDDDAWTNRPSSTQPPAAVATPPVAAPRAPSAPPAVAAPAPTPPQPPAQPTPPAIQSPPSLAKTTESDVFDQLARLSALKSQAPQVQPAPTPPAISTPVLNTPPVGYVSGMGMGSSPVPIGQHLNNQRAGLLPQPSPQPQQQPGYNGPRGPFAPVPANQSLLQPLIPTQTGFNSFIPTRPGAQTISPFANPPMQPSFLSAQPTGFPGAQPMQSQPTGFPGQQPLSFQPTGAPFGGFNGNPNGFVQSSQSCHGIASYV
jgi:hypothetical protein